MSPLRRRNESVAENVGAPLVTPVTPWHNETPANGLIKSLRMRGNENSPHRRLFLYVCNAPNPCGIRPPRRTPASPAASARPGGPRRAPRHPARHPGDMNVAPTATKRIRRGKRGGTTCDARNPAAPRPSSARHPGDMNVAPTWADCGKRRGATCDARCRNGTMESVANGIRRKRNPPQTESAANESAANGIPSATGVPPGSVVVYFCK